MRIGLDSLPHIKDQTITMSEIQDGTKSDSSIVADPSGSNQDNDQKYKKQYECQLFCIFAHSLLICLINKAVYITPFVQ